MTGGLALEILAGCLASAELSLEQWGSGPRRSLTTAHRPAVGGLPIRDRDRWAGFILLAVSHLARRDLLHVLPAPVSALHRHPVFSRVYPYISRAGEKRGGAEHRRALLAGLQGRVLEVGAGHGLNFAYYPVEVTEVVAVEPEPHLRELARAAASRAAASVEVTGGTAEALPAENGEFDAAVASLVLCSVDDPHAALREIIRALRSGGELRFYEHVVSNRTATARVQRALDATIYPALAGGCHCARDTHAAILSAGFVIEREQRIAFKPSPLAPSIPHILGAARRA